MNNARAEGVDDRVECVDGDARALPFDDATFDVVVSCQAIHNIYDEEGRRKAITEIDRVLKPGDDVMLIDFQRTAEYEKSLRSLGLNDVSRTKPRFTMFPPVRWVAGRKGEG